MKTRAVYPGTFDPVSNGHLDVVKRGLDLVDELYVAVAKNTQKSPVFSTEERVSFIRRATSRFKRVHVESFDGLVVEYCQRIKAGTIIRGLRATSDFDYEFQMALMNRNLNDTVQTVFVMPSQKHFYLSSALIKEVARLGGKVDEFVPPVVAKQLHGMKAAGAVRG